MVRWLRLGASTAGCMGSDPWSGNEDPVCHMVQYKQTNKKNTSMKYTPGFEILGIPPKKVKMTRNMHFWSEMHISIFRSQLRRMEIHDIFQEIKLLLLRVENIFEFSQTHSELQMVLVVKNLLANGGDVKEMWIRSQG